MGSEVRFERLRSQLGRYAERGLAVAFSGGVDSTVLLHAAFSVLGGRVAGVVADSPSLPRAELELARRAASRIGVHLEVLATDELQSAGYRRNDGARCYWCRHTLFQRMTDWARQQGLAAIAYGEILDDQLDERPGRRAAQEFGVVAPLVEAGLTKDDVRAYARANGLEAADKPASACLASRIPRGTEVTVERLAQVERAEFAVAQLGFDVLRVRDHGRRARVEVGQDELSRAQEQRLAIQATLAPLGYEEVELAAYRVPGAAEPLSAGRSAGAPRAAPAPGS